MLISKTVRPLEADMPTRRNPNRSPEVQKRSMSDYERMRETRIKGNLERMRKLGIFDMSLQLQFQSASKRKPLRKRKALHFMSTPVRRSFRLLNEAPVMYSEAGVGRRKNSLKSLIIPLKLNFMIIPHIEGHGKVLGESNMSWKHFADGYGQDGKRIYDSVRGKTCHQCRQKTLGHRTTCSKCNLLRGQFCGDCLSTRYGEQVLEANQNPDWICPPCRGICNCSLCRRAKGLAPTGLLYKKIASLGYKSVAHYLSCTPPGTDDPQTRTPVRRSLPYADGAPPVDTEFAKELVQHSETGEGRNQGEDEEKRDSDVDMHVPDGNEIDDLVIGQTVVEVADLNKQKSTYMPVGENAPSIERLGIRVKMMTENKFELKLESAFQENDLAAEDSELDLCNKGNLSDQLVDKETPGQEIININTPTKSTGRKRVGARIGPSLESIAGRLKLRRYGM